MAAFENSKKRIEISKANAQMLVVVGVASFITVFCLVATYSIWKLTKYQSSVISASKISKQALSSDISAFGNLVVSFNKFDGQAQNVLGGTSNGTDPNSGSNAKIVLDALPSSYDYPALATSIEKLLDAGKYNVAGISGEDDQLNQESNNTSQDPQPVNMPFNFNITSTSYQAAEQLIGVLQKSVRPLQIDTITMTGSGNDMTLDVSGHSFYQPGKTLNITTKVVQ